MSLIVDIKKDLGKFKLNVAFESDKGVMGFLGASGSGKSFTLKCIAGIETPDEGYIELNGVTLFDSKKKINIPTQKRHVGYLFQNYMLFPNMDVRRNIMAGMKYIKDKEIKENEYTAVTRLLQIEGLDRHKPYQLSGGQQQRVALARILVNKPNLLMMDEPFSALDTHLRGRLQLEMRDLLRNFGKTVLMVTHDRDEAYNMCSKIAVLEDGNLKTVKPVKELFANPGSRAAATITGCKNIAYAEKTDTYTVYVPEWGVSLKTKEIVGDDIEAVGIRAHKFDPEIKDNLLPVDIVDEIEEAFERRTYFRYKNQSEKSEHIWWYRSKDNNIKEIPDKLGVDPGDILLLY